MVGVPPDADVVGVATVDAFDVAAGHALDQPLRDLKIWMGITHATQQSLAAPARSIRADRGRPGEAPTGSYRLR